MSLLTIDADKCKHDGICVADCPFGLLEMKDKNEVPNTVAGADQMCINCGHCVAVCPHGALSLKTMPLKDLEPVDKELSVSPKAAEQLFKGRRSVRNYKEKRIDKADIEALLDTVRYAPTGHNSQQVNWLVVHDADQVEKIKSLSVDWMRELMEQKSPLADLIPCEMMVNAWDHGVDAIGHGAPHLVMAHAPKAYPVAQIDCAIALTYLELAAHINGMGVCWAGILNVAIASYKPLQEVLGLPEGNGVFGTLMLGYPKFKYHRIPKRKPASVSWL